MIVLSLFDGISAGRLALERAGIPVTKYYASEIDKYAIQTAMKNYPDTIQLGDITNWREWNIEQPDLIIGGSPCQGFSFAGKQLNFDDPRSKLFFEFANIYYHYKPKYFLLENVKMKKESQDIISQYMNCEPVEINSALVSAQNRKRLYWTNIPGLEQPEDRGILLRDVIEEDGSVDRSKSYCLDANYFKGGNPKQYFEKKRRQLVFKDKSQTIPVTIYKENQKSMLKRKKIGLLVGDNAMKYRKLTPIECERLQTFPEIQKTIEVKLCIDQVKSFVDAVSKNPKLLKLVGSAEKIELKEYAQNVAKNIKQKHLQIKSTAQENADIQIPKQIKECMKSSPMKEDLTQNALIAEKQSEDINQNSKKIKEDCSVTQDVSISLIEGKILPNGKVESLQKDKHSQVLAYGERQLKRYGIEIMQLVSDVEQSLNTANQKHTTFTTLSHLSMNNLGQILTILYYFALGVTDGCIHQKIKRVNFYLNLIDGYTEGCSNTQRYKALGNSWTVDVIAHIFKGLKK